MKVEITNTVHGCLEQGGVCGRIVSYDNKVIAEIMECSVAEAEEMNGDEIVPGTSVPLRYYLEYHEYPYRVIRRGTKIY